MLPFIKDEKKLAGVIIEKRKPDLKPEMTEDDEDRALEAAAQDIISAISSGDAKMLASAIKAAFDICDSQPHLEGEHIEE